jgi:hypothetical protein
VAGTSALRRRLPAVSAKGALKPLHPVEQLQGIGKVLDVLMPVRMRNHQLVIVAICLPPDFVIQPEMLAFKKPDHAPDIGVNP